MFLQARDGGLRLQARDGGLRFKMELAFLIDFGICWFILSSNLWDVRPTYRLSQWHEYSYFSLHFSFLISDDLLPMSVRRKASR